MPVSSYSFNSVIPRAQSFIIVISASDHSPMLLCCFRRNIEASCHTLRRRLPSKTNAVAQQRLVSSTRWSVAAKYIALRVHSTPWSQVLAQNRDFCLPHLYSTPPLGVLRRNIAMTFGTEKLERCGYPTVKIFWRYLYSFRQNIRTWRTDGRTDGQTPHDG